MQKEKLTKACLFLEKQYQKFIEMKTMLSQSQEFVPLGGKNLCAASGFKCCVTGSRRGIRQKGTLYISVGIQLDLQLKSFKNLVQPINVRFLILHATSHNLRIDDCSLPPFTSCTFRLLYMKGSLHIRLFLKTNHCMHHRF